MCDVFFMSVVGDPLVYICLLPVNELKSTDRGRDKWMSGLYYIRSFKLSWQRTKQLQAHQILSLNMVSSSILYKVYELKGFYGACIGLLWETRLMFLLSTKYSVGSWALGCCSVKSQNVFRNWRLNKNSRVQLTLSVCVCLGLDQINVMSTAVNMMEFPLSHILQIKS